MGDNEDIRTKLSSIAQRLKLKMEFEDFFAAEYSLISQPKSAAENLDIPASLEQNSLAGNVFDKNKAVISLCEKVKQCELCSLYKTRTNVVFGDGSLNAELVFVGEAPGRDEDLQGKPFVGKAGELLTKIINSMHLNRSQVYITNVLRCRPPNNRNPLPEEVSACKSYLIELLNIIKPKVICTLGKFAAQVLLEKDAPISRLRGRFYEFNSIKLMPTYHPAYLLRNPEDKRLVWDDMKKIMKALKEDEA